MTGADILAQVVLTLHDAGYTRWSEPELLLYLSEGQRVAARKLPACTARTTALLLSRNETRHDLPSDAGALIDMPRNLGANGSTPGKPISRMSRASLERFYPGWHSERGKAEIKHFDYDAANPKQFFTYPRTANGQDVYVEAVYSVSPDNISDPNAELTVINSYADALTDYVLHRAFGKDAEYAGEEGRSMKHLKQFYAALGVGG